MTVVRLVSTFPKLEKYAEVRSNLEERARSTPRMSLSQNIVGEIPVLVTTMVFDSLEDYEKDRTDPMMWEHRAKITGLMSQLITVRLLSPIVPPRPVGRLGLKSYTTGDSGSNPSGTGCTTWHP